MKYSFLTGAFFLLAFFSLSAQSKYKVLVTAFSQKVSADYFSNIGKVQIEKDQNDLYKVYYGDFSDESSARQAVDELKRKGYPYARVLDLDEIRALCADGCRGPLYVRNIFFDFDRYDLRAISREDLSKLATLLRDNPAYRVELLAHTDSRGSDDYNIRLSEQRASSARDYLVQKGIAADRIALSYSGETSPIAKNELAPGQDSPNGRQYNRRVEITVFDKDGKLVPDIVEPIRVPFELRL